MGHKTTIFGFVECDQQMIDHNTKKIGSFSFDEVYPFMNGFGGFVSAYRGATIPFSQNLKGDSREEWREWLDRFEELLNLLDFSSATVIFDSEMNSGRYVKDYIRTCGSVEEFENWFDAPSTRPKS